MNRQTKLRHEFVDLIPNELQDGTVYVCIRYATVVHRCCCGCGMEVVTPLSPARWQVTFDGETISLYPSIGNWSYPCRSHYWIKNDTVQWAPQWSREQIDAGRARDRRAVERYLAGEPVATEPHPSLDRAGTEGETAPQVVFMRWWQRLRRLIRL